MKPQIIHSSETPEDAYLIDAHAIAYTEHSPDMELAPRKLAQIMLKAVSIKDLNAGQWRKVDERMFPRPTQLTNRYHWNVRDPLWRGIYPDAAAALLRMPHGLNTAIAPGGIFDIAAPTAGYNPWHFQIAWAWSKWQAMQRAGQNWTLELRWQDTRDSIGFLGTFASFRQICSRLKLSVTKSAPYM